MKVLAIFLILYSLNLFSYQIDYGTTGKEYHFGKTYVNNLEFLSVGHNYLVNNKYRNFLFESHLGITEELILQKTTNPSFKNIFAGITVGEKWKYITGIYDFIPEVSYGGVFNIISDNKTENENILSFFIGIHIGIGLSYKVSEKTGYGLKMQIDTGYNNYLDKDYPREVIFIISIIYISLDFYD